MSRNWHSRSTQKSEKVFVEFSSYYIGVLLAGRFFHRSRATVIVPRMILIKDLECKDLSESHIVFAHITCIKKGRIR